MKKIRKGTLAMCGIGCLGLITEDEPREISYSDGNKGIAYVGIHLTDKVCKIGDEWSSRNPTFVGHTDDLIKTTKKITAADLLRLEFDRIDVRAEDNDGIDGYFYFTFNPPCKCRYPILITGDEDNENDSYSVEINELEDAVVIKDLNDLESLVDTIKRNLNNE